MAYEEQGEATSLYISYMVYMIITQTRCTMALLLAVIWREAAVATAVAAAIAAAIAAAVTAAVLLLPAHGLVKSPEPAQNATSDLI